MAGNGIFEKKNTTNQETGNKRLTRTERDIILEYGYLVVDKENVS